MRIYIRFAMLPERSHSPVSKSLHKPLHTSRTREASGQLVAARPLTHLHDPAADDEPSKAIADGA
jgi:hypothetical protein